VVEGIASFASGSLRRMTVMENPWRQLCPSDGTYVLDIDRKQIDEYNASKKKETKVIVDSIPEPFIGNPKTARLVLLNLNPGHSPDDKKWHSKPAFQQAMFSNLRHEDSQKYPFYPLDPAFKESGAGKWWRPLIRELQEETQLDDPTDPTFAQRLMVIEWFPYHSGKSALPRKPVCESQKYSFQLAKQMLDKEGVVVVGMRSKDHWVNAFQAFEQVPFLINRQRPYITEGNMAGDLFRKIVEALREEKN
jgi:hypothetical protein